MGQDEIDIVQLAHTTVVVSVPGLGDEVQAIKAGVLEAGEMFVINKADHPGADDLRRQLELMLHLRDSARPDSSVWDDLAHLVHTIESAAGWGVALLVDEIGRHRANPAASGRFQLAAARRA